MLPLPGFLTRRALNPSLRLVRDRLGSNPDHAALRKWAALLDGSFRALPPGTRTSEVSIGNCKATWIDVKGARRNRAILYLHGGAFILETPGLHSPLVARIAGAVRARALMPSYRLAPEQLFPAALDDCMAAYRHLLDNGFTAADIAVIGDSAGGNLSLALLLRARDEGLPLPACAVVMSPVTDATMGSDSIRRNAGHDAMFAPASFHALAPLYLPDAKLKTNPYVSPLLGDLDGLPPILIQVGSTELLLDDSVRFASKCRSATLEVWHDMPHIFPAFEFLPEAVDATQRIGAFVRKGFSATHAQADEDDAVADGQGAPVGGADLGLSPVARAARPGKAISATGSVYLGLALLAALAGLVPGISSLGGSSPGLLAALLSGHGFGPLNLEALLGIATLLVFAAASVGQIGWRRALPPVLAAIFLGIACGLALLLFQRER